VLAVDILFNDCIVYGCDCFHILVKNSNTKRTGPDNMGSTITIIVVYSFVSVFIMPMITGADTSTHRIVMQLVIVDPYCHYFNFDASVTE
jgi:hypothetical protein